MEEQLNQLRKSIDEYDTQIVELFEKRMGKALEVLHYKQEKGLPVLQHGREQKVIEKVKNNLQNKELHTEIEQLYLTIMKLSRQIQAKEWNLSDFLLIGETIVLPLGERLKEKKIVFQGEFGAFGHQALTKHFGKEQSIHHYETFEDVFKALQADEADYGILPIENSSTGAINDVYDLLVQYDVYIVGEQYLQVEHCLVGLEEAQLEDIEEVYSHIQGFHQSKSFLDRYPNWKLIPYTNTAASAKYIKKLKDPTKAAIASKEAAELYDLKVMNEKINTNQENWTRFIIIGKKVEINEDSRKISLIYSLRHNVGALYDSLGVFVKQGINLAKVESRPIPNQPWKYHFFVDIEGNLLDNQVQEAIKQVQEKSLFIKILGNY